MAVTKAVVEQPSAATVLSPLHWGRRPAAPAAVRVRITAWPLAAGSLLVLWSLTYLARQQLPVGVAVPSPLADFALEGAVLALAWLGAVLTACSLPLRSAGRGARQGQLGTTGAAGRCRASVPSPRTGAARHRATKSDPVNRSLTFVETLADVRLPHCLRGGGAHASPRRSGGGRRLELIGSAEGSGR
jgi:hypothetical protein